MEFKENAIVRHAAMPSWGVGKILKVDGELVWIDFSATGLKKLKVDIAAQHLIAADVETSKPRTITNVGSRSRNISRCAHCDDLLNRSQRRNNNAMKSCPKCSLFAGEHVFYPYPDEFGETEARAISEDPAGARSYCSACRSNATPPHPGGQYCSEIPDAV